LSFLPALGYGLGKVGKAFKAPGNLGDELADASKTLENIVENADNVVAPNSVTLRSGGDRLLESMGPARLNHADEFASIIDDLRARDVNIRFESNGLRYGPSASSGKVGNIVLDPDASISAIRHEYGHFLDDVAEGLPGARHYYENPWRWVATERRQYLQEIRTAKQLGDSKARAQLIQDYVNERRYILDTYLPKR
jgi:hypothetical protein